MKQFFLRVKIFLKRHLYSRIKNNKKVAVLLVVLFLLIIATTGLGYYKFWYSVRGSRMIAGILDLRLVDNNNQNITVLSLREVYPGWSKIVEGKVFNSGTIDSLFRFQLENLSSDFDFLAGVVNYEMILTNQQGDVLFNKGGLFTNFNEEMKDMAIIIQPGKEVILKLRFSLNDDLDDPITPQNEDDNLYQGSSLGFDLILQSTQANNPTWLGW